MTIGYTDPFRTVRLLDELSRLGFTNEAFSELHHLEGSQTIRSHREYCERGGEMQMDGTNSLVQKRLEIVLRAFWGGGFQSNAAGVWMALSRASVAEIPFI